MKRKFQQLALILTCSAVAACSTSKEAQPVVYIKKSPVSNQWIADKEGELRESIKGSPFTLRSEKGKWIVTAPASESFNPDRPGLLMPHVLRPITQIAKTLQSNPDSAVLVLGHSDFAGNTRSNHELSADRAKAVASIFRLSGFKHGRMMHLGMGNSYSLGHGQNNRVEIIITHSTEMQGLMAEYHPVHMRQLASNR